MNKVSYIITDKNITVNFNNQTHIVDRSTKLSEQLIQALRDGKSDQIPDLVSTAKRIENFSDGNFIVKDGKIFINGVEAPPVLGDKIIKFSNEKLPYQPLINFANNLQKNPSFRAINELFTFLEKNDHPITENGNFIAYKRVRHDFKDIHSGTFDNSVGKTVEMPRNQVDEDSSVTCSKGLHVANWTYAHTIYNSSGTDDIMLEVEVNPADVVAIPKDYNDAKMRVCAYKVLGVVDKEHSSDVQLRVTNTTSTQNVSTSSEDHTKYCDGCGIKLENNSYSDLSEFCYDCQDQEHDYCDYCGSFDCDGDCEIDDTETYNSKDY